MEKKKLAEELVKVQAQAKVTVVQESSANTDELQKEIKELADLVRGLERKRIDQKEKTDGTFFQRRVCILKNGKLHKDGQLSGPQVNYAVPQTSTFPKDDFGGVVNKDAQKTAQVLPRSGSVMVGPTESKEMEPKPLSRGQSILQRSGSIMSTSRTILTRKPTVVETPKVNTPSVETQTFRNGYLTKEGDKIKTWKKRWFRIHDNWLSYYNDASDTAPIKSINVKGGKAFNALSKCSSQRPYVFEFRVGGKVYYLNASSEDDKSAWMKALNQVIEKVNADKNIKEGGDTGPGEE